MKAQTSIVIFLLAIVIFGGLFMFLISVARNVEQKEYMNLYTSNLLLAMTRMDTGYTDASCKTVSDLLFCKFGIMSESPYCGGTPCGDLADRMIENTLMKFKNIKSSYDYYFVAVPQYPWSPKVDGYPVEMKIGDRNLKNFTGGKIAASKSIQKADQYGQYILKLTLYVANAD